MGFRELAMLAFVPAAVALSFFLHWLTLLRINSASERLPYCRGAYLALSGQLLHQDEVDRRQHLVVEVGDLLDALRRPAALPQANQPQAAKAPARQGVELFVRDLVQSNDRSLVLFRELVEPDVGALGNHDQPGHPFTVRTKIFALNFKSSSIDCYTCQYVIYTS